MGHLGTKDNYLALEEKIDGLWLRTPKRKSFHDLLKQLYTAEEARFVSRMSWSFANLAQVARDTGTAPAEALAMLDSLAEKGLVLDLAPAGETLYVPSPIVIGIFEFTMMRTDGQVDKKVAARLFQDCMLEAGTFFAANFGEDSRMSVMRTLPHETTVRAESAVEILDYEKAHALVDGFDTFGLGLCSCRHKTGHLGTKKCDTPEESCLSFGPAADYLLRHKMARGITRAETHKALEISLEYGLVLNADNTRRGIRFICQCCACCCTMLKGVSQYGYANTLITSTFIARVRQDDCIGCGKCAKACPIHAIEMVPAPPREDGKKRKKARINEDLCLGCGVCSLSCKTDSLALEKRAQRVIHPETTFERVILQTLDKGTLANQIFADPNSLTQKALRGVVGGFLRLPPVKQALMSDQLRSRFLTAMRAGIRLQGKGWLLDV
ncbi:MAG: 4Fe-4S binding protein [Proteobacteria bacterium]|nr:4Fe-4S binding protein [Pseudomonadota bacterium]